MKKFKAESKRVLDLMINSIYTHKEVFLRELISNASDAIDKLYFKSLSENLSGFAREDFAIQITADKEKRTLTISDNGCGMTDTELEENLGVIAHSGSLDFKQNAKAEDKSEKQEGATEDIGIIGQFGVGFYSGFMVADRVKVISRSYTSDKTFVWESDGAEGYTVREAKPGEEKASCGTDVVLSVKKDTEEEHYDDFLQEYRIRELIKKYSDYIRYPIKMEVEKSIPKEGEEGKYETVKEVETLNSLVPIWKKKKSEVTDEEMNDFYKNKFFDFKDPARVIRTSTEGAVSYQALLFVPAEVPFNYYSKDFEKGLSLYTNGVLIMDRCADLLPDFFSFVKGVVDTQDVSLNISRETLQHNRVLRLIETNLEKKIKSELADMLSADREKYETFFKNFGVQLKFGIYNSYGSKKDLLQDLLLFDSLAEGKKVTLAEYVKGMKEEQKYIYYACGKSVEAIKNLPQTELVREKGYDILCFTENVDEFMVKMIHEYEKKEFKSISSSEDLGIDEKKPETPEDEKEVLDFVKETLKDKVSDVKISAKLKSHPVCLSAAGEISLEMEKTLSAVPNGGEVKAQRVLELNREHPVYARLKSLVAGDREKAETLARVLYCQAQLIEGLTLENPSAYTDDLCKLIGE